MRCQVRRDAAAGFTLLQLLIAVVVMAILAAIAYPSYKLRIDAGRRADGTTALFDLANRMQRYYTENNTFIGATIANVGANATSPQGYYTLTIPALAANTYTLQATRAGVQAGDTRCGDLTLTSANVRGIVNNTTGITWDQCW